jgi:glycosyltransferase involved in cell wall biosynthesis
MLKTDEKVNSGKDALVKNINELNDRLRKEMAKKAVENIRKHYSWEKNLEAFEKLLEKKG